jgi:hypothetical protein
MLQIERKIQLMFEKLLNKQGSTTANVPDPATETPSELATVENGLVVLVPEMPNTTPKKRQKTTNTCYANSSSTTTTTQTSSNDP